MAREHVEEYFNKIVNDYKEMVDSLHDLEKECNEGLVAPERIDNIKALIEPMKQNYERISYIIFLLNQPKRKEKKARYERSNAKFIEKLKQNGAYAAELEEDREVLSKLKTK